MSSPAFYQRTVTVNLESGLHMTPVMRIVRLMQRFPCVMKIRKTPEEAADASSMLDLLTLGAQKGTVLTLEASGDQAEQALDALVQMFEANFEGDGQA